MKSLSCVLLALAACGGGGAEGPKTTTGAGGGSGAKPAVAGDVSFDVPAIEIKGVVFEAEALGRPGMPLVEAKKKVTLEKQRTVFTSTKDPVQKEAQAAILATMLYQKAKDDKANEKALWTEARQALRDAAAVSGAKVDEVTLRLLGSYELLLEDYGSAEKAWSQLVTLVPKDKDVDYNRAWWIYTLLAEGKPADALVVSKDIKLDEKQPEAAYAVAWAHWKTGDATGAWNAIAIAAKGWGSNANRDALERDVLLFAGRANVTLDAALPQLTAIFGKSPDQQYELLAKAGLGSYGFAGRWADGVSALDRAIKVIGDKMPPNDRPVVRFNQADFTVRLDNPVASAEFGKQALAALPGCGAKCTEKDKQDTVTGVYYIARLFHSVYGTANDVRYYQPAHDLYEVSIPLMTDAAAKAEAQRASAALETSFKNQRVGTGTHDKGTIGAVLGRHNQEVQACYEGALAANGKLGGTVNVTLDSDQSGDIKGVATEPKSGAEGLSAVAGCIETHAKTWRLPKRGMAGTTRIKLTYTLAPRK